MQKTSKKKGCGCGGNNQTFVFKKRIAREIAPKTTKKNKIKLM